MRKTITQRVEFISCLASQRLNKQATTTGHWKRHLHTHTRPPHTHTHTKGICGKNIPISASAKHLPPNLGCTDVSGVVFRAFSHINVLQILFVSPVLKGAEQKIQLPLSGFTPQSRWTFVSQDSSHLQPLVIHLLSSPVPLSSPLSTSRPLSSAFFSAGPADSWSRPGSPPPPPRVLKGAAPEVGAPRPSGSLTCPQ